MSDTVNPWTVYIVGCRDGTLYTGISLSLEQRLAQHDAGTGAKYTRGRGPVKLLASTMVMGRGKAQGLEAFIKGLPRDSKVRTLLEFDERRTASGDCLYNLDNFKRDRVTHGYDGEISEDATHPGIPSPEG